MVPSYRFEGLSINERQGDPRLLEHGDRCIKRCGPWTPLTIRVFNVELHDLLDPSLDQRPATISTRRTPTPHEIRTGDVGRATKKRDPNSGSVVDGVTLRVLNPNVLLRSLATLRGVLDAPWKAIVSCRANFMVRAHDDTANTKGVVR
jgi:hypothetical protein